MLIEIYHYPNGKLVAVLTAKTVLPRYAYQKYPDWEDWQPIDAKLLEIVGTTVGERLEL